MSMYEKVDKLETTLMAIAIRAKFFPPNPDGSMHIHDMLERCIALIRDIRTDMHDADLEALEEYD